MTVQAMFAALAASAALFLPAATRAQGAPGSEYCPSGQARYVHMLGSQHFKYEDGAWINNGDKYRQNNPGIGFRCYNSSGTVYSEYGNYQNSNFRVSNYFSWGAMLPLRVGAHVFGVGGTLGLVNGYPTSKQNYYWGDIKPALGMQLSYRYGSGLGVDVGVFTNNPKIFFGKPVQDGNRAVISFALSVPTNFALGPRTHLPVPRPRPIEDSIARALRNN